ncbi:DNA-directed DNA polymerase family A palm domain-containing protein OS=Lysinibacillus sphaericus OX=1421 GN=LS41612_04525 PE=4 SV=1 [Lysinibacillus sphaericus]
MRLRARVIAWLAGEQWRLDVFNTHGKIYEASASQMFGVPLELIKKGNPEYELRQKGKVAELALGYQGGSGALIQMGALNNGLSEDELPDIVRRWRSSNKRIVDLWYSLENAALAVLRNRATSGR